MDVEESTNPMDVEESTNVPQAQRSQPPKLNIWYLAELTGITKVVQIVASLAAFIACVVVHYHWFGVYLTAISTVGCLVASSCFLALHLYSLTDITAQKVNWPKQEFIYTAVGAGLYAILFVVMAVGAGKWDLAIWGWSTAAAFLAIGAIAFGVECYFNFREYRSKSRSTTLRDKANYSQPNGASADA